MSQHPSSLRAFRRHPITRWTSSACFSIVALLLMVTVAGCQSKATSQPSAPPMPAVEVALATTRQLIDYREFTGRTSAMESVEIRARVSGYLLAGPRSAANGRSRSQSSSDETKDVDWQITAKEGDLVKKGTHLFLIDPKPYRLALDQSLGSLKAAQARLTQANQNLARSRELLGKDAASESEYDQAVASVAELRGQIENLKATAERNLLDLEYTKVESPIDGLLGRTMVTEGNLVIADTTVLTTVVSVDPIYVDFNVDERSLLDYRKRMVQGEVKSARNATIPIAMALANEDGYPHKGTINFIDNRTDPNTGNTKMRGVFENQTGILSPGLFARVRTPFTEEHEAILIPSPAYAMDQQGRYVMIVDDDNKVSRRSVKIGQIVGDKTVVTEGVQVGEKVIVSGLQGVRPGMEVTIKHVEATPDEDDTESESESAISAEDASVVAQPGAST